VRKNNRPRRELTVLFIAFIVFAAVLGALMLKKYAVRRQQPVAAPHPQQGGTFLVTLFFASPDGAGLVREGREIDPCVDSARCVEAVVGELINGPLGDLAPTLPAATSIHAVQVNGDLAQIDLGEEMIKGLPGGSNAEMEAVYSIVDSIAVNFPRIKQVKLMVNGKAVETLNGHLDLRGPLTPDFTLEKKQG
jgi:spore germination protein GerM